MTRTWYRLCHWLCARVYYHGITVRHRERLPTGGPVIYLGTHRNGAMDGFVYRQAVPRGEFLISTQLLRSFFARLFFHGIPVARAKDGGDRDQADASLVRCREWLADGGELFVFPEGTSTLGPRHLPFKSGAARIAVDCLSREMPLRIVPIGIHYERAWAFRSRVEIEVGVPVATDLAPDAAPMQRLGEMKRRCAIALESVGANFKSGAEQELAEMLAGAATLGTSYSYAEVLKIMESGVPESLLARWRELEPKFVSRRVWRHQGVPLFPTRSPGWYGLMLALLAPVVIAGALTNLPPLLAGGVAARKLADDRNVIALWRIMVGLPVLVIWFMAMTAILGATAGWPWALGYVALTGVSLQAWHRTRKLAVAVGNAIRHPDLIPVARKFHQALRQNVERMMERPADPAGGQSQSAPANPKGTACHAG